MASRRPRCRSIGVRAPHRKWPRGLGLLTALPLLFTPAVAAGVITVGGACNLNAAIAAANGDSPVGGCPAGSGADRIELTANVELTVVDNTTDGDNGLPSVTSKITLDGDGYTVFRSLVAPAFRLFHIAATGDLRLENVTLAFGLIDSLAARGGAVYNRGDLSLSNTAILNSEAEGGVLAQGGGIFNENFSGDAPLTSLDRSVIQGCSASAPSGGSSSGGAIFSRDGVLIVRASTLANNGVEVGADSPGSSDVAAGGAVRSSDLILMITDSTFSGNQAKVPAGSVSDFTLGGALAGGAPSGPNIVWIANSTISGNSSCKTTGSSCSEPDGAVAAVVSNGDIIYARVEHTTFFGNDALWTLAGFDHPLGVAGSLFASSTGHHCLGIDDLGGGNLADDLTCAPTIADTLAGLDPNLTGTGGPTETHALLPGSTAIDIAGNCGFGTDQRGAGRMSPCDSGAYERIPCALLQTEEDLVVSSFANLSTCHTALLAPGLTVTGSGDLRVTAGFLVNVQNGFRAENGSQVILDIDPSLLP